MAELTDLKKAEFKRALAALHSALALKGLPPDVQRDVVLLRFELVAEMMPKVFGPMVGERGASAAFPKDIVRQALAADFIDEGTASALPKVIYDRNPMVHDYSEEFAESLFARIRDEYARVFKTLLEKIS